MKQLLLIFALTFCSIGLFAQADDIVIAFGKLKVEWGNLDRTEIQLFKDGKMVDEYSPARTNGKFEFPLELNHQYQFYFSKRNYVTKIVNFNTTVPDEVLNDPDFEPFTDFDFYVTLFESFPEVDTMFFKNPVGKIQYSRSKNDFDWDKDYTLEIQRKMEQIEADIRNKREQAKLKKELEEKEKEEQRIAEEKAKKEAEKQAELEKERLAQEKKDKEKAEREAEKLAEKQQEQEEKEAQEREEQERDAADKAEKEREKQLAREQKLAENQVEEEQEEETELVAETTPVKESSVPETVSTPPQINLPKTETQQTRPAVVNTKPIPKKQTNKVDVTKQNVAGKQVTRTEVSKGDITEIYLKVEYDWGGRYFFIQDEVDQFRNISESYYNIMISKK